MKKQYEYCSDSFPCKLRSTQSPNISSKPQNGTIEGTEDTALDDSTNEEIKRHWQHIETSLTILRLSERIWSFGRGLKWLRRG